MRYGVLGTGVVGQTLASELAKQGHEVKMGSREAGNEKAVHWASQNANGSEGTFADAALFGEVIINATAGSASLEALTSAGAENIGRKIIVDVANPLDFSKGFPPSLTVGNTNSLGEQIQNAFPDARVVKTLNTVNAALMVSPRSIMEHHNVFVCGNDPTAKAQVRTMLNSFGWPEEDIVDLGDVGASRAVEAYLMLWTRLFQTFANPGLNIRIVR